MTHNPLTSFEGELQVDNRASPGLPEELIRNKMPPAAGRGGTMFRVATLRCWHCGGIAIKNPERTRPRNFCRKCVRYICDGCALIAAQPDYAHRSFDELADLVRSGRYTITGGSAGSPILVPTSEVNRDG